jgi:putative transposase
VRNVLAKLPENERDRVKSAYWPALYRATNEGNSAQRLRQLIGELTDACYHPAAACLADDDALIVHLRYPLKHRRVWRSTNLLERSLGEAKRRTKVIGRFPGGDQLPGLCWAVLDPVIAGANRVGLDDLDRQDIERIANPRRPVEETEQVTAA